MALDKNMSEDVSPIGTKDSPPPQYGGGVFGSDPEKGEQKVRKMSRIGGPIPGIVGDSDVESQISVGKQVELEQTNSIKYRTCSWQKVWFTSPTSVEYPDNTGEVDSLRMHPTRTRRVAAFCSKFLTIQL